MTKRQVQGLDVFRSTQAQDVANRWQKISEAHRQAAERMWLGSLVFAFNGFELGILRDMGFLSPREEQLLSRLDEAKS